MTPRSTTRKAAVLRLRESVRRGAAVFDASAGSVLCHRTADGGAMSSGWFARSHL